MDTKYLFKRHNTYWVKVAVPKDLRKELGFDLRISLQTHELSEAQKLREAVVEDFKSQIFAAKKNLKQSNGKNAVKTFMPVTDTSNPQYYHKVVDCQYACPAHTPVPEYIRKISKNEYTEAYMINWESNVFPGILGRTCDRPCEPACRRTRTHEKPVAICRLKRVAADFKDDVSNINPSTKKENTEKNSKNEKKERKMTRRDFITLSFSQ